KWGTWFGSRPAPSPEVADALAELAKLTQPSLAVPAEVLRELLPVLFEGGTASRPGPESLEAAHLEGDQPEEAQAPSDSRSRSARGTFTTYSEKLASGIPLWRGEAVPFPMKP